MRNTKLKHWLRITGNSNSPWLFVSQFCGQIFSTSFIVNFSIIKIIEASVQMVEVSDGIV
jgi:hypothetical protein